MNAKKLFFKQALTGGLCLMVLAAGFFLSAGHAQELRSPGTWEYLMTDPLENKFYVDMESITREGQTLTFREKILYGPRLRMSLTEMFGMPVFFDVRETRIDCQAYTIERTNFKPVAIETGSELDKAVQTLKLCDPETVFSTGGTADQNEAR